MIKLIYLTIVITITLIGACNPGYVVNKEIKTNYIEGRDLYISRCSSCHKLYSPNDYSEIKWDSILVSMKRKAKLSDDQQEKIYYWILEVINNNQNYILK